MFFFFAMSAYNPQGHSCFSQAPPYTLGVNGILVRQVFELRGQRTSCVTVTKLRAVLPPQQPPSQELHLRGTEWTWLDGTSYLQKFC
jgi:hypothetical protein